MRQTGSTRCHMAVDNNSRLLQAFPMPRRSMEPPEILRFPMISREITGFFDRISVGQPI